MGTDCMAPLRLVYKIPDFRSYFLIWIKLARTVNEIHGDLLSTFPGPGLSTLQRWHTEFDKGVLALEKKTRPGRPRETRTEENVARVKRLVEDNPRMTTRQVTAEVSLRSTTVFRLLTEDLGLRNLLSVFVPHQLSEANKMQQDEFGGHEEATLAVQRAMRRVSEDELYGQLRKLGRHCSRRGLCLLIEKFFC
ncbi:Transposase [Caligus rogercresseyi]|uniref:Transposase n=1 Tax=Caligus rogercresseyi TaxID=217165 RepID=A0A7T8QTQ7_CALRO|nr:Transposase [Caligus rogercresseyi]